MGGDVAPGRLQVGNRPLSDPPRVVRVAVDIAALADQDREFDYLVPAQLAPRVTLGALVRVPFHGRRVAGWVVGLDVEPPPGVRLQPLARVSGLGPSAELVELSRWARWRWAGRRTAFLRAASPDRMVPTLPTLPTVQTLPTGPTLLAPTRAEDADLAQTDPGALASIRYRIDAKHAETTAMAGDAIAARRAVVRLPPAVDPVPLVAALAAAGPALVVCAEVELARRVARGLTQTGVEVAMTPDGWPRAAAGGVTVIGARAAAWAPAPDAAAVVVLDAHDRSLAEERAPTWNGWVVAAQRAEERGIPCVLVSPCPRLEHLQWGTLILPSRATEREGWAPIHVIDRTQHDPRAGLLTDPIVGLLRGATVDRRTVCILNRKGRVKLLACRTCGALTVCERCTGAMEQPQGRADLRCRRCHTSRPMACQACGAARLRAVRLGVAKVRDDIEALTRAGVAEVTAESGPPGDAPVIIGTEAALHRLRGRVGEVVFLDFDAELSAPRYSASEDALAMLAVAARLVGGRAAGGGVHVQSRQPGHAVLAAAARADPDLVSTPEAELRAALQLPPYSALAEVSGDAEMAAAFLAPLTERLGLEVLGPVEDRWVLKAPDHRTLCDALATAPRPPGATGASLRVSVDPDRL